jgi:hypothetical protein
MLEETSPLMNTPSFFPVPFSRLGRIVALLVLCCFAAAPALAKRMAPKEVKPVVVKEVEYTAPTDAMGFVVATDVKTKKELWREKIYTVTYIPGLETDIQDVFISELAVDGNVLVITDEKGTRYALDLATRKVSKREK